MSISAKREVEEVFRSSGCESQSSPGRPLWPVQPGSQDVVSESGGVVSSPHLLTAIQETAGGPGLVVESGLA